MEIKAVFFDMFNTLADPHEELVMLESSPAGLTAEEYNSYVWDLKLTIDRSIGVIKTEEELMERVFGSLPVQLSEEQKTAVTEGHRERMRKAMTEIPDGIEPVIADLKNMGLKLGIISIADVADYPAWPESPIYPYFDDSVFSCDVGIAKPDPGIYEIALKRLGVKPEEAVFVGDGSNRELMGAKNVGMTTIWTEYLAEWDQAKRESIRPFADHHVKDFSEIPGIIDKLAEKI